MLTILAQIVVNAPAYEDYRWPTRLFLGTTADVLPDGMIWLHGGIVLNDQFVDYGIWHGVFNLGLSDLAEVRVSMGRLLSAPLGRWFQVNEVTTALKLKFLNVGPVSAAVDFKANPGIRNILRDTMLVFNPEPVRHIYLRIYHTRMVAMSLPITLRFGRVAITAAPSITRLGVRMELDRLPSTDNCLEGVLCDSLIAWLSTEPFRESPTESRLTFKGGYLGGEYMWRENAILIAEFNLMPKFIYRGMPLSDTLLAPAKFYPDNRAPSDRVYPLLYSLWGIRYALLRSLSLDIATVIPYDFTLPPDRRLNLLNATIYLNFNLLFPLND
ncbi:MAG: hypothetical protein GXO29_01765 [Thermotogae bacterium]|nr:hypothetical protein [Thermotogota bacterium]